MHILDLSYIGRVDGKITFSGVLSTHFEELFSRCEKSTLKKYASTYNKKILPVLGNTPVEECTEGKLTSALQEITSKQKYSKSTISHFRYLMSVVVEFAVKNGHCGDALYGSPFHTGKNISQETVLKNEVKANRKSLSPKEEVDVLKALLLPPAETSGTNIGLLCMLAMGLRNHEACGLTWEAIRPLDSSSGIYVAWIYESTVGKTSELQASGKTKNMGRKIPLYPAFGKYLLSLKAFRKEQIARGEIVLDENESEETLPIVWNGENFKQHCTSAALSAAGRLLLSEIKFEQDRLLALKQNLEEDFEEIEEANEDEQISLKDPTAYLLRRNFGTHLSILGFSDESIEYLMGHKIESEGIKRNMFSNEDQLKKIFLKLNMRPLFGSNDYMSPKENLSPENQLVEFPNVWGATIPVTAKKEAKATIRVSLKEPEDEAKITIKKTPNTEVTSVNASLYKKRYDGSEKSSFSVNIMRMYQDAYRAARGNEPLFDAF